MKYNLDMTLKQLGEDEGAAPADANKAMDKSKDVAVTVDI